MALVPPMSVKGRPLHWVLGRSQTYYPEHILVYGNSKGSLLSCRGFWLFPDRLIEGGDGGGRNTALSLGLKSGGLESKFGRRPGPHDREWWVGLACAWGTSGAYVSGYPAGIYWITNRCVIGMTSL